MKIFYMLFIGLLCSLGAMAQATYNIQPVFTLTFEDTSVINQVFYSDSAIDPHGIWQIGVPDKSLFDSALTVPDAVVTLLDTTLPAGSMGSFIITLPGIQLGSGQGGLLTFVHRFQFDTAHGRAYVEYSVDTGRHWHPILITAHQECYQQPAQGLIDGQYIYLPVWWDNVPKDTTADSLSYFTGTDTSWVYDSIAMPNFIYGDKTSLLTQYLFRFTAYTDSLSPALAGWMIDNIAYSNFTIDCPGGINEINSAHLKVYPDPATDAFTISILNEPESDYQLSLYDLSGRAVMQRRFYGEEIMLQRDGIDPGSYFIQVTDTRTGNTFQKRIIFE